MNFEIVWVKGDYGERQARANELKCVAYVEHHFNALIYRRDTDGDGKLDADAEGQRDNPTMCLVASNASLKSKAWASDYTSRIALKLGVRDAGCVQVKYKGRGDYNIRLTHMPAILVEPLFVSDLEQAKIAQSDIGQETIARCLVESLRAQFPQGGKIAFSVGHMFKRRNPHDRGAPVAGNPSTSEAELSYMVLRRAEAMLMGAVEALEEEALPESDKSFEERLKRVESDVRILKDRFAHG